MKTMTQQNFKSHQSIQMSTKTKRLPNYLKDYHYNLNVFNTSS